MPEITEPLRLAVGSHKAGSGKGCAMNVISWENGDKEITDLPACVHIGLARMIQDLNDLLCKHTGDDLLLCAACSVEILDLAHSAVGTANGLPLSKATGTVSRLAHGHANAYTIWDSPDYRASALRLAREAIALHKREHGLDQPIQLPVPLPTAISRMKEVANV